jgi:c-di-GMP-binding flagellar brake protein YcgR
MGWKDLLQKLNVFNKDSDMQVKLLKPTQSIRVRLDVSPNTYITRIEDIDKENIYVSGITDQELNFAVPLAQQKVELYVFSDNLFYRTDTFFKRKIDHPIYLWVLHKPNKLKIHDERRRAFRLDNVIEANIQVSSKLVKQKNNALTKNVSCGGLAMISPANIPLKSKIEISMPAISNVSLPGEIVWKYEKPYADKWYYGVKFIGVDDNMQTVIGHYINQRLKNLKWLGV